MKLKYVTPVIAVEAYALSQTIAACATRISFTDSKCVISDPDSTEQMKDLAFGGVFSDGCSMPAYGMDGTDKICYHTNANATFTS
ncbi:MAG: hypothetical protein IKB08_04660 [Clostridia bacterium]|nr:hypothetical protein [Oscillospiraceae bacterium]MBR2410998.1 hypothetical protein [Clostridia bacterium]